MDPILPFNTLMSNQYPERKWLVEGLIPSAGITILSAEPGSYKTYLLLEMALAVVQGRPLFGQFDTTKAGVLIIDMENGEPLLQQRLRELGAPSSDLPIYFVSRREFIVDKENTELAILNCKAYDIKLLMIDSLVRVHRSDENVAGEMAQVFERLRQIADTGIAVVITHHNRKPGANTSSSRHDMRGSSDILAAVDCHIGLRRKNAEVLVEQTKLRSAKEMPAFKLHVEGNETSVQFEYVGSAEKTDKDAMLKVMILGRLDKRGRLMKKDILAELELVGHKTNEHKLKDLLAELVSENKIRPVPGLGNTTYYELVPESDDE